MAETLAGGLVLPLVLLAAMGFAVPRLLARLLPEGVRPLLLNAFLSTLLLVLLSGALFFALYHWRGAPVQALATQGGGAVAGYFGRLGLRAVLVWGPVMVLSLAGLPRKWKTAVW